jgi:hypothetical protein
MTDKSNYTLEEKVAWLEGAFEQMEKRVESLERRHTKPALKPGNGFEPDMIGTVTISIAGFMLLLGIPFDVPGAIIGAMFGLAVGLYNVTVDRQKRK